MELVCKARATAPVWIHFGFVPNERGEPANLNHPICRLCRKKIAAKSSNTSNLYHHLKNWHPAAYAQICPAAAEPVTSSSATGATDEPRRKARRYARDTAVWRSLTDAVTHFLADAMLPPATADSPSFRAMLESFDGMYELPDGGYFSRTALPVLYARLRAELLAKLRGEARCFAATAHTWRSARAAPLLTVRVHYVGTDWVLHTRCLQTAALPESHSADHLGEAMRSALANWDLAEARLQCVTTPDRDCAAAAQSLGWPWLACFGHSLHAAVLAALGDVSHRMCRAAGICRSLASAFSQSQWRRSALLRAQTELELPQQSLIMDSSTQWGSMQKMLERFLQQYPAIQKVLCEDPPNQHLIPTLEDIAIMESVNSVLKPLKEFTDVLSEESHLTASSLFPVLKLLKENILSVGPEDTELMAHLKSSVWKALEKRYELEEERKLLAKGTFLDPRYRGRDLEDVAEIKSLLMDEAILLERIKEENDGVPVTQHQDVRRGRKRSLIDLLKKRTGEAEPLPLKDRVETEFSRFVQEEVTEDSEDPLCWWRASIGRFPVMAKLARKYLCVVATSSPPSQIFSSSSLPLPASLKPDKVDMLVFLSENMGVPKDTNPILSFPVLCKKIE